MAENFNFRIISYEHDQIASLELGGLLVLENAQQLKDKLIDVKSRLTKEVKITISELDEIDLSCIQILVAFMRSMDELDINYRFEWNVDEDQKQLLEHVGFTNELYLN